MRPDGHDDTMTEYREELAADEQEYADELREWREYDESD